MTKLHIRTLIAALPLAAAVACATGGMPAQDAGDEGSVDARPRADAAPHPDASPISDAGAPATDAPPPGADAIAAGDAAQPAAYRHTMTIDGVNDFDANAEQLTTTSNGYAAFVSWDDDNLYLAYEGPDIASGDTNKWVLLYLDIDPGTSTGAAVGELYNTQRPGFPAGFGADYYFRWKASGDFYDLQRFHSNTWSIVGSNTTVPAHDGTFVELAIPLADLGPTPPSRVGVIGLMLNETPFLEGAYAGLYSGSFPDGYYDADIGPIPIASYLEADFASALAPNDAANQKP